KKNADVIENFEVTDLLFEGGRVVGVKGTGKDKNEKTFNAKVVVGADGAGSIVASKLGLNNFEADRSLVAVRAYYENVEPVEGYIEFHFLEELMPGYFWIFPVGDNEYNVGIAVVAEDVSKRKLNLKDKLNEITAKSRFSDRFRNAKQITDIKGWNLPTGAQKRKRAGDGFILVGDAASLIDPFTGEGIGNALTSGKLAAETIADAIGKNDFSYRSLGAYEEKINATFGNEFAASYKFQRFGKNPVMFNALIETLSRDKNTMKIATSTFMKPKDKKATFKIPFRMYLRVLFRYISDVIKIKVSKNKHLGKV
ncbi:MAG: NAD(P)/FAD-dependent oxidoreductase, partial [Candidatus Aenigmatarchaeota archaeon]